MGTKGRHWKLSDKAKKNIGVGHTVKDLLKIYNLKTIEDVEECKEFWNINLGTTLCVDCHSLTKGYMGRK